MSSSQCPICFENFPASAIERHASSCKGKKEEVKLPDSTPTRTSPWSAFKRKRCDGGNGGAENESPKPAKVDKKEEQETDVSDSVKRKERLSAYRGLMQGLMSMLRSLTMIFEIVLLTMRCSMLKTHPTGTASLGECTSC